MARAWTVEERTKQAELIRRVKPWEKSTGPRTKRGKKSSSMNAKKPATVGMYCAAVDVGDYREAERVWRRMFGSRISHGLAERFEAAADAGDYVTCNRIHRRLFGFSIPD
jgi:hypothetical protein